MKDLNCTLNGNIHNNYTETHPLPSIVQQFSISKMCNYHITKLQVSEQSMSTTVSTHYTNYGTAPMN
jgi:hypothetical protein